MGNVTILPPHRQRSSDAMEREGHALRLFAQAGLPAPPQPLVPLHSDFDQFENDASPGKST
jgi:hypothetical protein